MSWFYRHLVRPVLFTYDPEQIHNRTLQMLGGVGRNRLLTEAMAAFFGAPDLPIELFGLTFPNPVGLAAGMDKNAEALPAWAAMGFGFTELGAATWHPQPGNLPPRVFRAIADEAIVNRMGFNNLGATALAETLKTWRSNGLWPKHPVGVNLGKSKVTPLEEAAGDYVKSFEVLLPWADFFVVNVSSPNTPNLRQLQDKVALDGILAALQRAQPQAFTPTAPSPKMPPAAESKPVLVKVAPDLSFEALDEILELVVARQIAGVVATNTTVTRPDTSDASVQKVYAETGGLSGRPLRKRATEIIRHIYRQTRGTVPIMGAGGIFSAADAWEKITAGASLLQIYTSLVYEGPGAVKGIISGLFDYLEQNGLKELREAIGIANR